MSEPTESTTFTLHDPKVQQGIVSIRNISILTIAFSLFGIDALWDQLISIIPYLLIALSIICLWKPYPVKCTIDATTETLIVHQQRLWQHRTTTYPLMELHDTVVQRNSLVFILASGKRIIIGPFTDVSATAQALCTFMDRAFPAEPPESTMGVSGK
ncbi:MAG: hypothetical protein AAGF95_17650 [Chloroflexota bacterium]